jgi:predicted AlkP superfamily phosphohydrolase/phosphomutase
MARLFILGLDGGTLDLILPWARNGRLPHFARLLEGGSWGPLKSVPNMNTAPAWSSFMTGVNPGKHGVFWFAEEGEDPGTVRFVNAADRRAPTLWRLLSDAGKRVGVVNVPLTFPVEQVNGVMIAGFDAPSTSSDGFSHPPGLLEEIQKRTGPYLMHAPLTGHAAAGRHERVIEEALKAEESRVAAALALVREQPWDVFMYMIKATDQAAHYLWQYGAGEQSRMRPIYEYADRALGRFLEAAGPDCGVLVMSDHGMGWRQPAAEYLNDILEQLGYLKRAERTGQGAIHRAHRLARSLGPRARGFAKKRLPGLYRRYGYKVRFGGIDWSRTRAYCDNTRSCVWINLEGRNPRGIVPPAEYKALAEELREVLQSLVDIETKRSVVDGVWFPQEQYSGPYVDRAPDLQIDWRYEKPVGGLLYEGPLGRAESSRAAKGFMHELTGAHRPLGVLIGCGPQFAEGHRIEGARIEDVAPTVLHALGVPVPEDMDGRVATEALAPRLASAPVSYAASRGEDGGSAAGQTDYSDEEAAQVEERLRSLGYI